MTPAIQDPNLHHSDATVLDKNDFVMEVLYDGRYINELTQNPEKVAAELGLNVNEKTLREIQRSELTDLMGEACDQTAIAIARDEITAGYTRPPSMDIAIPAVVAIVGVTTTIVSTPSDFAEINDVDDDSPDAEDKL